MDALVALVFSALVIAPTPGGNLLAKDVSSWSVDMDWTEVIPGLEVMIRGTYHNVTLLFSTKDPWTFQVVLMTTFHGQAGLRGWVPYVGMVSLTEVDKVVVSRFVGDVALIDGLVAIPEDGRLSSRGVGSVTVTVDGVSLTEEANLLLLAQVQDGTIVWAKVGVPMGWPFQVLAG